MIEKNAINSDNWFKNWSTALTVEMFLQVLIEYKASQWSWQADLLNGLIFGPLWLNLFQANFPVDICLAPVSSSWVLIDEPCPNIFSPYGFAETGQEGKVAFKTLPAKQCLTFDE